MGLFVFGWGDHAKAAVEASVVVPVDPAGGGVLDVGEGLVRPVVEDRGVNAFGLIQPDYGLHQRVVVGVADGADGGDDAVKLQILQ